MRRVLMISPHFPPDSSAGAHRVRLLAPHLPQYGWEPTVVAVDARDYEGRLDAELCQLVPRHVRVVRCRAWSVRWTRRVGIGDLGLRAFSGLYRASAGLLHRERFHALFITMFPSYPALIGPILKRRYGVPFVLDYQDPWVSEWGRSVGAGPGGSPDFKSRLSRFLAIHLEPHVVRAVNAITAVSSPTYDAVRARNSHLKKTPCVAIPVGGEPADFYALRATRRNNRYFNRSDDQCHVCYVGTVLPLGFETLRAVLKAVALLRTRRPALYDRLRLHFIGTSNQTTENGAVRVVPVARELGVGDRVMEVAPRIDYLDALTVQAQAGGILMLGSTEHHYTASKLYPGLLAGRPILAVYHEASSVVEILRRAGRPPSIRVVTYNDRNRAESRVEMIYRELAELVETPLYDPSAVSTAVVEEYSAASLARRLATVLDGVACN